MKSMLHEATTVTKAIEKAWADSGQPSEFTVKILESGEKNFLGFSKHPAIISITYDPKKQLKKTDTSKEKLTSGPQAQNQPLKKQVPQQNQQRPYQSQQEPQKHQDNRDNRQQRPYQQTQPQTQQKQSPQNFNNQQPQQQGDQAPFERTPMAWIDEWIETISKDMKEVMVVMGVSIPFTVTADKKTLHINFTKNILATPEEERLLFISLSYLLIQFLKKRFKKKLRGFHLLIKSKQTQTNESDSNSSIG